MRIATILTAYPAITSRPLRDVVIQPFWKAGGRAERLPAVRTSFVQPNLEAAVMPDLISEMRSRYVASQEKLIQQATEKVLNELGIHEVTTLKSRFDEVRVAIEIETYRLCLQDEKRMVSESVHQMLLHPLSGPGPCAHDEVAALADSAADQLAKLFMHVGQSRRSKAGKTFERNIRQLFRRLDYPSTSRPSSMASPIS